MNSLPTVAISDIAYINPTTSISHLDVASFVGMEDVSESFSLTRTSDRDVSQSSGYTRFQDGDLLFAKITPCMENGKGAHVGSLTNGIGFGSTEFHVLRARSVEPRFLVQWLKASDLRLAAEAHMTGSAGQRRVPTDFFARYRIPLLPRPEQRRIAEILDTLDDQIRTTERIIDKLKLTRQGLITDLLVNGFSGKCEGSTEGVLDNFVTWLSGGTPFKGSAQFWSGEVPWVTPKDMKAFVLERTTDYLSEIGVAAGSRLAPLSAVFIVVRGMILAHTFPVSQTRVVSSFNQDIKAVVPGPLLEPRYLAYWFVAQSDSILRLVGESTHGTKKLDLPDLKVFPITIPSRDEQLRILRVVDTHQQSIDLESAILSKLQTEKQGLMADLLTGRVRVTLETAS